MNRKTGPKQKIANARLIFETSFRSVALSFLCFGSDPPQVTRLRPEYWGLTIQLLLCFEQFIFERTVNSKTEYINSMLRKI